MSISPQITLAAIVGSLRRDSVNRVVFEAAAALAPAGTRIVEAPVADVPFYNGEMEGPDEPAAVTALKTTVQDVDGLLFFTPEYNHSVPAVTKNALDWLSRPFGSGAIAGKPTGIVAATPGGHAGGGVREHLAHSAGILTDRLFADTLGLGRIFEAVADGRLTDPEVRDRLAEWLERFVAHATSSARESKAS